MVSFSVSAGICTAFASSSMESASMMEPASISPAKYVSEAYPAAKWLMACSYSASCSGGM